MENKCIGIAGKLFGHKYETVYDVTNTPPSVEEAEKLMKLLPKEFSPEYRCNDGTPLLSSMNIRRIETENYNQRAYSILKGKEVETPLYDICSRCGHKIQK